MNSCEDMRRRMSAYGEGELPSPQWATLQSHLVTCSPCRAYLVEMERLSGFLRLSFATSPEMEEDVSERVMQAIRREPYRPVLRRPFAWKSWLQPVALTAALAGVAAIASGVFPLKPEKLSPNKTTASPTRSQAVQIAAVPRIRPALTFPPTVSSSPKSTVQPHQNATPKQKFSAPGTTVKLPVSVLIPPKQSSVAQHSRPVASHYPPVETVGLKTVPAMKTLSPPQREGRESIPLVPLESLSHPRRSELTDPTVKEPNSSLQLASNGSARLQQVAGTAQAREDDTEWSMIQADSPVRMDQRVRSGEDSRVSMTFEGGLELKMNEATEVVPMRAPQPDAPFWVVRLVRGEIFARVPRGKYGLKVLTPAGDAMTKGGEFIVRTNDLFETRMLVAKGRATLENDYGKSRGVEGTQVSSRIGAAPDFSVPVNDFQVAFRWAYSPLTLDEAIHQPR